MLLPSLAALSVQEGRAVCEGSSGTGGRAWEGFADGDIPRQVSHLALLWLHFGVQQVRGSQNAHLVCS